VEREKNYAAISSFTAKEARLLGEVVVQRTCLTLKSKTSAGG